jgi:Ca-activated chloride channel family protein
MWRPMAEAMGWPDTPIGWDEIVALASDPEGWARYGHPEWGQFKFGHTHPGSSNTGFLAMTSLAYNTLDITQGLTPELVRSEAVVAAFNQIEQHTYHYGLSTRSLFTAMARRGPSYLHAGTNSEIGVLATNFYQAEELRFPLAFVAPKEGAFWSENPYCILETEWVTDEQREAAAIYRDYLLGAEAQAIAIDEWLRPADPNATLRAPIDLEHGTDPRISPATVTSLEAISGETTAAIQDVFLATKKRATIIVLLDISGSMDGGKIRDAVAGLQQFISTLHQDDKIYVYTFSTQTTPLYPGGRVGNIGEELIEALDGVRSEGGTSLYDGVCRAVQDMAAHQDSDRQAGVRQRLYGIVLLSDGDDTKSVRSEAQMMACLPSGEDVAGIKIFTVAYGGNVNEELMERIAQQTNGKSYVSDPESIEQVYLEISYEQ